MTLRRLCVVLPLCAAVAVGLGCNAGGGGDPTAYPSSAYTRQGSPTSATVLVPSVVGYGEQTARATLARVGLQVLVTTSPDAATSGTVIAQTPAPSTRLPDGATVRITVAAPLPVTAPPPPPPYTGPTIVSIGTDPELGPKQTVCWSHSDFWVYAVATGEPALARVEISTYYITSKSITTTGPTAMSRYQAANGTLAWKSLDTYLIGSEQPNNLRVTIDAYDTDGHKATMRVYLPIVRCS